jgi:AcrR family transcriptional regulator
VTDVALPPVLDDEALSTEALSTETKGERTRRKLLEIAIAQFGRYGFRQTSVTEITREAGLTQAACYAYFGNKGELFREAVDTDVADLITEAAEQAGVLEPRQMLGGLVLFLGGALERHPLTRRVLQGREPDAVAQLIDLPAVHSIGDLVAVAIRRGQASGEVRADIDPDVVGAGAEAIVLGLTMSLAMGGGQTTTRHAFGVVSAFDAMLKPA